VTIKAKAVAEFLLLFKKSKKEQIYQKNEKENNKLEGNKDTVVSELFIRCLQSFLSIPSSSDITDRTIVSTDDRERTMTMDDNNNQNTTYMDDKNKNQNTSILQIKSPSIPPLPPFLESESGVPDESDISPLQKPDQHDLKRG
jgi:hypothetical protein